MANRNVPPVGQMHEKWPERLRIVNPAKLFDGHRGSQNRIEQALCSSRILAHCLGRSSRLLDLLDSFGGSLGSRCLGKILDDSPVIIEGRRSFCRTFRGFVPVSKVRPRGSPLYVAPSGHRLSSKLVFAAACSEPGGLGSTAGSIFVAVVLESRRDRLGLAGTVVNVASKRVLEPADPLGW